MPDCTGNGTDHCCYVEGERCVHLEENTVPGRRWACGLRRELGDWDLVHADPRYAPIQAAWERGALAGYRCGEWPAPGFTCGTCGIEG